MTFLHRSVPNLANSYFLVEASCGKQTEETRVAQ